MVKRSVGMLLAGVLAIVGVAIETNPADAGIGSTNWKQVSGGFDHTCAVTTSGRLFCWGADADGQLGDGDDDEADEAAPVPVAGEATDWTHVAAGSAHSCARKSTGALYCWGSDVDGQLGDGDDDEADEPEPVLVGSATDQWKKLAAGNDHTCARKQNDRLFCWGSDDDGQVGDLDDDEADEPAPVQVFGETKDWTLVDAGDVHTCAVKSTGRLFCWGRDDPGQIGDGDDDEADEPEPVEVAGAAASWKLVSAGGLHTCARRSNGRLFCWGANYDGELGNGDGSSTHQQAPVQVVGGRKDWAQVASGVYHTCATRTTGRLFCWGYDGDGQVGDVDDDEESEPAPVQVLGNAKNWKNVAGGERHTCAVKANGKLFCWGQDGDGQVGDGDDDEADEPEPVEVAPHP